MGLRRGVRRHAPIGRVAVRPIAVAWHGDENAVAASMVVGIYNASGTVWGEVAYVLRKVVGQGSCALCDITHGWSPVMRTDFKHACAGRAWAFDLLHTNEASGEQLAAAGPLPAVVRKTPDGWLRVLGPAELASFARTPEALLDAIEGKLGGQTSANGFESSS